MLAKHSGELQGMVSLTRAIVRLVMAAISGRAVVTRILFGMVEGGSPLL